MFVEVCIMLTEGQSGEKLELCLLSHVGSFGAGLFPSLNSDVCIV